MHRHAHTYLQVPRLKILPLLLSRQYGKSFPVLFRSRNDRQEASRSWPLDVSLYHHFSFLFLHVTPKDRKHRVRFMKTTEHGTFSSIYLLFTQCRCAFFFYLLSCILFLSNTAIYIFQHFNNISASS